jgi:hypothetical protein
VSVNMLMEYLMYFTERFKSTRQCKLVVFRVNKDFFVDYFDELYIHLVKF